MGSLVELSQRQLWILIVLYTIGTSILVIPSILAFHAKHDAWIASLVATGMGIGIAWLYEKWVQRFGRLTPTEVFTNTFGRVLGGTAAIWFGGFCLLLAALCLRNMGDFVITTIMQETPIEMIHLLYLAIAALAVRLGPETFARAAEIIFPWVLLFVVVMTALLLPEADAIKMFPLFSSNVGSILTGASIQIGTPYLEVIVLLTVAAFLPPKHTKRRPFITGILFAGLVLTLVVFFSIAVLGADLTARQVYPSYVLARQISIGRFLERLESIMAGLWFLTVYFKMVLCFFSAVLCISQLFKLKDYRPLTLPVGIMIWVLSIIVYPNSAYINRFINYVWMPYACTVGLILPAAAIIVSSLRKGAQQNE
jgi:spore germination protein KB